MSRMHGKVAIITGGASGLGAAIARKLLSEAAHVVITDLQAQEGASVARELGCEFMLQDVTEETRWAQVVAEVEHRYGSLDVLINNAGIEGRTFSHGDLENTELDDWRRVQRVNVEGVFLGCRAALPALCRSGGGSIVNMSSTAGLGATPDFVAYGASKAAVGQLTRSVALQCARSGSRIRCNSVHPGIVLTAMLRRIAAAAAESRGIDVDQVLASYKAAIPQGEFQEPEDVAAAVSFLASDEARHITGIQLVVDGGVTLQL